MAPATVASAGPRYAPEDPTLPKPWRGLIDDKTGYLYFWNPETNITQYERPGGTSNSGAPSQQRSLAASTTTSAQVQEQFSHGQHQASSYNDNGDRHEKGDSRGSKFDSETKSYMAGKDKSNQFQKVNNGEEVTGYGGSSNKGYASAGVESGVSPESYRRKHEITVSGNNVPHPFVSFDATSLPSEILREVQQAGFSAPTPIQAQSWPIALQGRDIVAVAKTGSGKTLGYLIPGFVHLKRSQKNSQMGPIVLVLSPTRELATQIQAEAIKFGKSSRISCTCLYGGASKALQLRELGRGTDIVVATPGRLNDILEMKRLSLHQVSYLVLDEADRMLDMGFEPQIRKIANEVPTRRQTLMYTATWPKEVRKIAADLLVNPIQVNIGNIDDLVANKSITQHVEFITSMEKHRRLEQILRSQEPGSKIIIFCSTKKMCDQLARNLTRQFGAAAIHGDKSQGDRDYVLGQFRSGRCPILVATDVAARGLDIKDIRVVVNYDFPTGVEDYVHRIGRTGRAGATGIAYTFFSDQDGKYASDLIKVLEGASQRVPPELRNMASRGGYGRVMSRWGSSRGSSGGRGRNDSGYGGRNGYGMQARGSDRDSDRYGSGGYKSFHERMNGGNSSRARSRSRSRSPPKSSGWGSSRTRPRSRSPERFDRAPRGRSYHDMVMEKSRSSRSHERGHDERETRAPSDGRNAAQKGWGSNRDEEVEEGMIRE